MFVEIGGDTITEKQKKFADAYIKCLNATEAYMEAYGAENRAQAARRGCRLKKNAEVKEYIEKELEEIHLRAKVDAKKVLELLAAIAFTSPAHFVKFENEGGKQKIVWKDVETLPEEVKRAIAVIKNTPSGIAIETLDRMKAIDLLMKYMGIDKQTGGGVVFEGEDEIEE